MFPNASWFEIAFVLIVSVGVGCGVACLYDATRDRAALRHRGINGVARALVNGNIRNESVLLCVQLSFLAWGCLAMALEPAVRASGSLQMGRAAIWWALLVIRIGFLLSTVLMAANSLLNLHERRETLRKERAAR